MMTDDDDEFRFIRYERIDAGRYVVVGELRIDGKMQTRRIPCADPAFGFARLEAEVEELLPAHERAKAVADAESKRARGKKKLGERLSVARHVPRATRASAGTDGAPR
jgi:hypothetical protein